MCPYFRGRTPTILAIETRTSDDQVVASLKSLLIDFKDQAFALPVVGGADNFSGWKNY